MFKNIAKLPLQTPVHYQYLKVTFPHLITKIDVINLIILTIRFVKSLYLITVLKLHILLTGLKTFLILE